MKEPSFSRDVAAENDSLLDDLVEAFASAVNRVAVVLPTSTDEFRRMVTQIFATCFADIGAVEAGVSPAGKAETFAGGDTRPYSICSVLASYLEREVAAARAETAVAVIGMIIDGTGPRTSRTEKLAANALAFASGMHGLQEGKSQTEIGKKLGVGRAAVSRRVTKNNRELGLHPSRGQKSPAAVEAYRQRELAKGKC